MNKRAVTYAKALVTALENGDVGAAAVLAQQVGGFLAMRRMCEAAGSDLTMEEENEITDLNADDPASFYVLAMKHAAAIRHRRDSIHDEKS